MVGEFVQLPYLVESIRRRFCNSVPHISTPPNPEAAVLLGAVALASNRNASISGTCKRAFGFAVREHFEAGVDPIEYRRTSVEYAECRNQFRILVRKGDAVSAGNCVSNAGYKSKKTTFRLFSSEEIDPRYTAGDSVTEGVISVTAASGATTLSRDRKIMVAIVFGVSSNQVKAEAVNFLADELARIPIEVDYLLSRS